MVQAWAVAERKGQRWQRDRRMKQHGAGLGKATRGDAGQCSGLLVPSIRPVLLFIVV